MTVACTRTISLHVLRSGQGLDELDIEQKGFSQRSGEQSKVSRMDPGIQTPY